MADHLAVSVVVAARDAARTIERCLDALTAQEFDGAYEIIVCDNGSRDSTARLARAYGAPVRVIGAEGAGPAAARNGGVAVASGEILAFTDADCFPVPGWLAAGVRAMRAADLVQGPTLPDPLADRGPFDRTLDVPGPSAWFPTANLFARRDGVLKAGGFPAGAVLDDGTGRRQPLGEDTVLAWRLKRAGARTAFAADAVVHHEVSRRSAREFVRYRAVWRALPAVVAEVPELRRELLFARCFLERRTALFDLAVCGLVAGAAGRRAPLRAAGAACAIPYGLLVAREAWAWRGSTYRVAPARLAADCVACAALVAGSVRAGVPVV